MEIKSKIGLIIEKSGLRDDYIASKVGGINKKTVYNWKTNRSYPTFEKAFILAKILNCKVDDLAEVVESDSE